MSDDFDLLISVDEEKRRIVVDRIRPNGQRELYTYVDLPGADGTIDRKKFAEFARLFGENVLIGSPAARRLLGL